MIIDWIDDHFLLFLVAICLVILFLISIFGEKEKYPEGDCRNYANYRTDQIPVRCLKGYLK